MNEHEIAIITTILYGVVAGCIYGLMLQIFCLIKYGNYDT